MSGHDAELDQFRQEVSCAVLLERATPPWQLDRKGSTRRALKYRRHQGEVVIVNHDGRGWWDAQGSAKGDVFDLVQFLDPGLNFGQVRKVLRPFVGLSPTYPEALPKRETSQAERPLPERWASRPRLRPGSRAWDYLTGARALPRTVLLAASEADAVRDGAYRSAWFAHRDRSRSGLPHRSSRPRLQRLAPWRDQDPVSVGGRSLTDPAGRARGADRRAEPGGPREHPARHNLRGNRRRV